MTPEPQRIPDGSEVLVVPAGLDVFRIEFERDGAPIDVYLVTLTGKWRVVTSEGPYAQEHDSLQAALGWLAEEGWE